MIYLYICPTNQILSWNWNDFLNYDTPVLDFWVDNSTNGYRFDLLCQKRLTILEVSKELEWKFLMQRQLLLMLAEFCYTTHIGPRFFLQEPRKKPQSRLMLQWHSQLFCPELLELSQAQWLQRIHEGSFNFHTKLSGI